MKTTKYLGLINKISKEKGLTYLVNCGCTLQEIESTIQYKKSRKIQKTELRKRFKNGVRHEKYLPNPETIPPELKKVNMQKMFRQGSGNIGKELDRYIIARALLHGISEKAIINAMNKDAKSTAYTKSKFINYKHGIDETKFSNEIVNYYNSLKELVLNDG